MHKAVGAFSTFSVSDIEAAKQFYGGKLGLAVNQGPMGNLDITLPGGTRVTAYPKPNHEPASFTILNFIVPNVEETVDELTSSGIAMEHYDMPGLKTDDKGVAGGGDEPQIAWFKDPFGNVLSVIENRPGMTQ